MISFGNILFGSEYFLFVGLIAVIGFLFYNRNLIGKRSHLLLLIMRSAVIVLLFVVLANPYSTSSKEVLSKNSSIVLINDGSASMGIFHGADLEKLKDMLSQSKQTAEIKLVNMSSVNRTALGDTIYAQSLGSSQSNNIVVISSDGNNNYGSNLLDIASFAAEGGTKIFSIIPDAVADEIFIKDIVGDNKVPVGSEYEISVIIGSVTPRDSESKYQLKVYVDDSLLFNGPLAQKDGDSTYSFNYSFEGLGEHIVSAKIEPQSGDKYVENNVFQKSVKVIDKPRVLYVDPESNDSPLRRVLTELYDIEVRTNVPTDPAILGQYNAIVLNGVSAESIDSASIRRFLNNGGGLMVIGGDSAYDYGDYYGSSFENLLPVKSTSEENKGSEETNVVIVIDISGSTQTLMGSETKIDVEKAIATDIMRDLAGKANVGVVVFNTQARVLRHVAKLDDSGLIEDTVSRLRFNGGTYISEGLKEARKMLTGRLGSKYVVLISDGKTDMGSATYSEAEKLVDDGVVLHTVGVGFDTDEGFMKGIAKLGSGVYFAPTQTQRVQMILGLFEGGDENSELSMIIINNYHFITEKANLGDVPLAGFNEVSAKPGSQVLAATPSMKPLLTVWRFGLGRVVSLSVDDGSNWASALYNKENSKLISASLNWAIGDSEKSEGTVVDCLDTRLGEQGLIVVKSDGSRPELSLGGDNMELSSLNDRLYYLSFEPTKTGSLRVTADDYSCLVAVNYPQEYGKFGINDELLLGISKATGGRVYEGSDLSSLADEIIDEVEYSSQGTTIERINMQMWFSLLVLLIFFADIALRRITEIRDSGKKSLQSKKKKV